MYLADNYNSCLECLSILYDEFVTDSSPIDVRSTLYPHASTPTITPVLPHPLAICDNHIPVFLLNARSLCNKVLLFQSYVREYSPLIICVTESWGHREIDDAVFALPSYSLYRVDRQSGVGGGVLIYVSHVFPSAHVSNFSLNGAESVTCRINLISNSKKILLMVTCVYRPPSYILQDSPLLDHLSEIVSRSSDFVVVCGDFNCPEIKWSKSGIPIQTSPLILWSLNNFLSQYINIPTRPASQTILDLVFASVSTPITDVKVNECFGSSDHALITFKIMVPVATPTSATSCLDYSKAKWSLFRRILLDCTWPVYTSPNISKAWNKIRDNILFAATSAIPTRVKRPWNPTNSSKVRTALRSHRRTHSAFVGCPSLTNRLRVQLSKLKLNRVIYAQTCKHETKLANNLSSNPKPFWSYIKSKTYTSPPISAVRDSHDDLVSDFNSIVECFADRFSTAFNQAPTTSFSYSACNDILDFVSFSTYEVHSTICALPLSSTTDLEGICYLLLKKGGFFLASKLCDFFNRSMYTSTYPPSWKTVNITPVYKSGDREICSNYRPIAITSCVSRIMERILAKKFLMFLRHKRFFNLTQHGFLPGSSVETASLVHLNFITSVLDNGMSADVVYLDFAKAFDTVPHYRLLQKLDMCGVHGRLHDWLSDYLHDRHMVVSMNGHRSNPRQITSGVIQGSVLGPLLFLVYINDVDDCVSSSTIIKYADDIKLAIALPKEDVLSLRASRTLQNDLSNIQIWSLSNGLALNTSKCNIMHYGNGNPCHPYFLNGRTLDEVTCFKDLGVLASNSCSFKLHVSRITLKANRFLGVIKRTFVSRDVNVLLTLYKSHIRSILEYCNVVWCPHLIYLCDQIETIQRRFSRLFPHLRSLPYRDRLQNLNLLSLRARRLRYKLIFLFKIVNGLTSLDPLSYFTFSNSRRYNSLKIVPPHCKRDCRRYFFFVDVIFHWNDMSDSEVNVSTVDAFKKSVKSYFRRIDVW